MGRWIAWLWIGMLAGCAHQEPRCEGKLTAINAPGQHGPAPKDPAGVAR